MRRVRERGGECVWWWTVDPTGTEGAVWPPAVPPGTPALDPVVPGPWTRWRSFQSFTLRDET